MYSKNLWNSSKNKWIIKAENYLVTNLWTVTKHLHDRLYGEEGREEKVEIAEYINIEEGSVVVFEHQGESVEDDQQQDKVFKRRWGDEPPSVVTDKGKL